MKPVNIEKGLCIIIVLMFTSICFAGEGAFESGPWEVSKGSENVLVFEPEYIPSTLYFYALSMPGRSDEIIVTLSDPEKKFGNAGWRPKGLPLGHYVYVLHLTSKTVSLMAWEDFKQLKIVTEFFHSKMASAYPDLNYQGESVDYYDVIPFEKDGRELVLAPSFADKAKERHTFGLPSIIPFMGRKKFIEKETYHTGATFIEVFNKSDPAEPLVQFQRSHKKLTSLPQIRDMACWMQGTKEPILVIVESSYRIKNQKGRIFVVKFPLKNPIINKLNG